MTGYFTEFKADNQVHDSWNEQSAVTSTAVCILSPQLGITLSVHCKKKF